MTIAEQIAELLGVPSTDVRVSSSKGKVIEVKINGELITVEQEEQIDSILNPDKHEINQIKEENKRLKAEIKALRDRIADAIDFPDLKTKMTTIKDSEETPPKWMDKADYLEDQHVEHKGIIYIVLEDHTADKAKEPQNTPEWYREQ